MKTLWIFVLIVLSSIVGYAANPSFDTFDTNDFNVVRNPPHISLNHSLLSATNIYATNLYTTINISSNIYATNLYSTNIYATNITATYITNYFATMDTTIINTLTANYFYAYSYIVNTNYGIWTNDNSAYPYSIVHILDDIPYSYVAMSNTLIKGTESVLSKSQVLALGTNVLESGTRSQFLLISPTNDAAQVVIELNGGTNTVQKLEIYNLTNANPALGAFTLVANSAVPDSLSGGLVKLRESQNWVATNGAWIELRFVSPDWIEMDRGTLATSSTGGGTTINPTDGYLPYRSNSTTFGNSPWYRITTNSMGFSNTNLFIRSYADQAFPVSGVLQMGYESLASITSPSTGGEAAAIAIGERSMEVALVAANSTAVGWEAAAYATNFTGSTALGAGSGSVEAATNSVFVGAGTGNFMTSTLDDTVIGNTALIGSGASYSNAVVGFNALYAVTSPMNTTAIGAGAGYVDPGGLGNRQRDYCTFVGALAGVNAVLDAQLTNAIAIGFNTRITNSNEIVVGNGSNTRIFMPQPVIPTHTPASSAETNYTGAICWDADYLYVWTTNNVNKRVALTNW